jgi:hypothetical protein
MPAVVGRHLGDAIFMSAGLWQPSGGLREDERKEEKPTAEAHVSLRPCHTKNDFIIIRNVPHNGGPI